MSGFRNRIVDEDVPRIERSLAPTDRERAMLEARRTAINTGFISCDRIEAAEMILRMFDAWPGMRMEADKAKRVVVAYTEQLAGIPGWAVRAGVAACQRRATAFPPSAGELRAACEAEVRSLRDELRDIDVVLNAQVFEHRACGAEAKARVRAAARKLGAPVPAVARAKDIRDNARSRAERSLATMDYASKPVTVSGDLARSLR